MGMPIPPWRLPLNSHRATLHVRRFSDGRRRRLCPCAQSPDLVEGTVHRLYIVFEGSHERRCKPGTEPMATTREMGRISAVHAIALRCRLRGTDGVRGTGLNCQPVPQGQCRRRTSSAPGPRLPTSSVPVRRSSVRATPPVPATRLNRARRLHLDPNPARLPDPSPALARLLQARQSVRRSRPRAAPSAPPCRRSPAPRGRARG